MNRQEKATVVASLKHDFASSKVSFVVGLQRLTVKEIEALRSKLRKSGGKLQVAKARLAKIAAQEVIAVRDLIPYCKNQIGFVFASDEPPVIAKVLHDFAKEHEALSLIAGCLDAQLVDGDGITRIATLPSKEVLLAQVCGTMKAPIAGLVNALNQMPVRLIWALNALAQKK